MAHVVSEKAVMILRPGDGAFVNGVSCTVIEAIIGAGSSVEYQVAWMNGNVRHCERVSSAEVDSAGDTGTVVVGFAK